MSISGGMKLTAPLFCSPVLPVPQIVLGDRDQNATLKRLSYYTRYLTRQDSRSQVGCRHDRALMREVWVQRSTSAARGAGIQRIGG